MLAKRPKLALTFLPMRMCLQTLQKPSDTVHLIKTAWAACTGCWVSLCRGFGAGGNKSC